MDQLFCSLLGMQATLREFEDWLEDPIPDSVMIAYEKALAKLEECLPYEDTLVNKTYHIYSSKCSISNRCPSLINAPPPQKKGDEFTECLFV